MNEQERQQLIEWLVGQRDACDEIHGDNCKREQCITAKIALASLKAPKNTDAKADLPTAIRRSRATLPASVIP